MMRSPVRERGVTLIELIVSIVVIAIAVSAVLGVLTTTTGASADPLIQQQAIAIAESYLEEISLNAFSDPDGSDGEASRTLFDDIDDYDGLSDSGARDQLDNPIAGLTDYNVSVTVVPSSALPSIAASDALRVDVRVVRAPEVDVTLSAYRVRF
jgi:MSHA pilin protein MshD